MARALIAMKSMDYMHEVSVRKKDSTGNLDLCSILANNLFIVCPCSENWTLSSTIIPFSGKKNHDRATTRLWYGYYSCSPPHCQKRTWSRNRTIIYSSLRKELGVNSKSGTR